MTDARRLAYRIDEAAERIGLSRRMIYKLAKDGKLTITKIGGCSLIPAKSLNVLLANGLVADLDTDASAEQAEEAPATLPDWARGEPEATQGTTYIYVIKAPRHVKIGITDNPSSRLSSLQSASPYQLSLAYRAMVTKGSAKHLEFEVHNQLATSQASGEWFNVSIYKAVSTISRIANSLDYTLAECPSLCPSNSG